MSKKIKITIPFTNGVRTVKALAINPRWCAYQEYKGGSFSLTHRPTGYSAAKFLNSYNTARALALKLEKAYSVKRWSFTDPQEAKGMKKARAIVERHTSV